MNDMIPEKAAAYARRSTMLPGQERSIPEQIKGIKETAQGLGIELDEDLIFIDEASGTTTKNRHGLEALKKAARDGTLKRRGVTHLLYWSTDRIARNTVDALMFEAEMSRQGIRCYSVSENYDVTSMGGKMDFTIRSVLAEAQNKLRAADTKRGQRSAVMAGKYIFKAPYGYSKNEHRLCINIPEAAVVRRMFQWLLSGQSPRQITRMLNDAKVPPPRGKKWHHAHVAKMLRQETYAGLLVHGIGKRNGPKGYKRDTALVEPFHHPAILDWNVFIRAQKVLGERSRARRFTATIRHFYLLGGLKLLHCGVCGAAVTGKRYVSCGVDYFYYTCLSRSSMGRACGLKATPCRVLDEIVLEHLEAYARNPHKIAAAWAAHHKDIAPQVAPAREEVASIDQKLLAVRKRKERLVAAFAEAEVALPVLKAHVKQLTEEDEQLERRRQELKMQINRISKTMADAGILDKLADFRKTFDSLPLESKKMLVRTFVQSVTIKGKDAFEISVHFLPQSLIVPASATVNQEQDPADAGPEVAQ